MDNVTIHNVTLEGAAKIFETFMKGNQIIPNDNQVLSLISIKISSCLWWDMVRCSQRYYKSYKNYIKPQRGFNQKIIQKLRSKIKDFSEQEKFVVTVMDETKIQENLVWIKYIGERIEYIDLGDTELNYATLPKVN